jgi:hypothetical protein
MAIPKRHIKQWQANKNHYRTRFKPCPMDTVSHENNITYKTEKSNQ